MLEALIAAVVLIGLAIAGIAVKMFFKPQGQFTKTCGSKFDPKTGKAMPCSCSSQDDEECENAQLELKLENEMPA
ncbi:MAG: hypothetical protein R6U64_09330 [Bacteroidales bacterium]